MKLLKVFAVCIIVLGMSAFAMAELAAIFESRVYARTVQQATSWMGEGLPEQFDRQVEQTVRIHTDVQLEGARIGRVQPDKAAGGFRALAVLDRRQAISRWQRELAETQEAKKKKRKRRPTPFVSTPTRVE